MSDRLQRSTVDLTANTADQINEFLGNEGHTLAMFLDYNKAFDMTRHTGNNAGWSLDAIDLEKV